MCGITGWIHWEKNLTRHKNILEQMTATMSNRGPDDAGIWLSPRAALGHRRLSVVDPEGGIQPMTRQQGTYVITYNGELYNTPELRSELESRGYRFLTRSDTEVLLVSFIEWEDRCVDRLNGIFAFGIWDDKKKRLFMARDRLGVKPLFYAQRDGGLLFGSELKALLAHPDVQPRISAEGLAEIFALGPSRTPGHGVFDGIYELKPGFCMFFQRSGLSMRRYWQPVSQPHTDDFNTTICTVRELLQDSVKRQLVADVPVCTLLSGGLDSSALTAFAAKQFRLQGNKPIHTYSIDYADNDNYFKPSEFQPSSDASWIERVSEHCGTQHHYVIIDTPQLKDSLINAVTARDLPGMADVDGSLYLFCRLIKQKDTVALSGECADEIFGGYPWFHNEELLNNGSFPWLRSTEQRKELLSAELLQVINPEQYIKQRYQETISDVPRLPGENPTDARRREMFYLNMQWFMTTLLDRKDRMSMATGLEVRVPFCDHRLVEYAWNIPWEMKSCDGREKGILRRALIGVLPTDVLERRKSPYPKTHNPNYLFAVQRWLSEVLNDSTSPLLPLIDVNAVRSLTQSKGDTFNRPWFGQLMTGPQLCAYLCQIDHWLRTYKVEVC